MPRTTAKEWARLFNFAGGGIVHLELFALFAVSALNPSLFEAIAQVLFPYGTHSARPTVTDTPLQSFYFETDTDELYQNQNNAWVQVASIGGGGGGPLIQVNGVDADSQSILNFVDSASVTWADNTGGDIEATSTGGAGGGLTLIEHKLITSNSTTVTFSSLNGNTDGAWRLSGKIKNNSGSGPFYKIAPNGATTNLHSLQTYGTGGSTGTNTYTDKLTLGFANANATICSFNADIFPRKSANSIALPLTYQGNFINWDASVMYSGVFGGEWTETSTNVTTLDVVATIANGIGDGSELWLYKYEQ